MRFNILLQISKTFVEFFFSLSNGNTDRQVITLCIAPTAIFLDFLRKNNKLNPDFWTSLSRLPLHIGGKIVKIPSVRLVPNKVYQPVPKGSNKQFSKRFFLKIPDFIHRPTAAVVTNKNRR